MKIVHIIQRYPPAIGGSEQWCQQMSCYLAKQGQQVQVLSMRVYHEEEFTKDLEPELCRGRLGRWDEDQGVKIHRYGRTRIPNWVSRILLEWLMDKKLGIYFYCPHSASMYLDIPRQIWNADLIYLHAIPHPHNFFGLIWAKIFNKKVVITPHFHPGHDYYERACHYWLMKKCDAILVTTQLEKEYLISKGIAEERVFVSGCSIDPLEYQPHHLEEFKRDFYCKFHLKADEKVVTFLGRRVSYKGVDHLIHAVSELNQEGHKIRLLLVGPSLQWFDDFYNGLSYSQKQHIIDLGIISHQEKVNVLYLTNVVVLPSSHESFGIVFLEAWACNVPVIGAETETVAQLLDGGGKTVPYGDIKKLKEAIVYMTSNATEAQAMAKKGRKKLISEYTTAILGERILGVLKKVVREKTTK